MNHRQFFVGSLPHTNPKDAIEFVKRYSSHLPFLPQLPEANPQEDMVAQVVKGIELGGWDENCASALERFQNEFNESPQVKIQLAGPLTLARTLSENFDKTILSWLEFSIRLMRQMRQGAFTGEIWLQVDEPSWSAENPLPENYLSLFSSVLGGVKGLRLGLHSCATHRPVLSDEITKTFGFFHFDFSRLAMTEAELGFWSKKLQDGNDLAIGCLTPAQPEPEPALKSLPNAWIAATCGLYGWPVNQLAAVFGRDY